MIFIVYAAVLIFALRVYFMLRGSLKEKKITFNGLPEELPFVSVIIPARNEEANIEACLRSLEESTYPMEKFELIVVNDMSEDKTSEIIEHYRKKHSNIIPLNLTQEAEKENIPGKPGAIHAGIKKAKGEYLLMTDADCVVEKKWIENIVTNFQLGHYDLLPSFTLIKGNALFDKIQEIEWIYMHTMASAGIGNGYPLGCYGNNLSIRNDTYERLGGYPEINFSVTEDLALLLDVYKSGGKVHYICDRDAVVTTNPCETFSEYIKQKKRWAVGGTALKWKAVAFVATSVMLWAALFYSLFTANIAALAAVLATRVIGDYFLIDSSLKKLKLKKLRKWIIPSVLFFMFMELIIPFTLLSKKVKWKGRTFN